MVPQPLLGVILLFPSNSILTLYFLFHSFLQLHLSIPTCFLLVSIQTITPGDTQYLDIQYSNKPLVTRWLPAVCLMQVVLVQLSACSVTGYVDMVCTNLSNTFLNVLPAINTIKRERRSKYPAFFRNSEQRGAGALYLPCFKTTHSFLQEVFPDSREINTWKRKKPIDARIPTDQQNTAYSKMLLN